MSVRVGLVISEKIYSSFQKRGPVVVGYKNDKSLCNEFLFSF